MPAIRTQFVNLARRGWRERLLYRPYEEQGLLYQSEFPMMTFRCCLWGFAVLPPISSPGIRGGAVSTSTLALQKSNFTESETFLIPGMVQAVNNFGWPRRKIPALPSRCQHLSSLPPNM